MGIIKKVSRKSGETTYFIDYYVGNHRVREGIGTSRKQAKQALARRRGEAVDKRYGLRPGKAVTYERLVKEYLAFAKSNKRSWDRDERSTRCLAVAFGGRRLDAISTLMVERYKTDRLKQVAPATVNRELACLKHMFNKAIAWNLTPTNPVKGVRLLRENNVRARCLDRQEIARLLDELPEYLQPLVQCALYTGMRKGELLNLKWQDVDLESDTITVRTSKNDQGRFIPIAPELHEVLSGMMGREDFVFSGPGRDRIRSFKAGFDKALKRAGIEDFRFHDLRHTFASHLVRNGVDLLTVKELMGHKTLAMTLRYAHLSPDQKRSAVRTLGFSTGHILDTKRKVGNLTVSLVS